MIKKDITFIYVYSVEKALYEPIIKEAENRGYTTHLTDDIFSKCEIGVYCEHVNFPQYSKLSVIMLHDIVQQHWDWPDIWAKEPWNKYDIGILPNDQWAENWKNSSKYYYAKPRTGAYEAGWPKADKYVGLKKSSHDRKTVLYAPSWENDNKGEEFIEAVKNLDVDVIIKYAPPSKAYPPEESNMRHIIEKYGNQSGITVCDWNSNILDAILKADILVSEESSTMCEAVMLGIPAVAVSDWLVPDVTPARMPDCDYDFVIKTPKAQLHECLEDILNNYEYYKRKAEDEGRKTFCNAGQASKIIMDIIDDCVDGKPVRFPALVPEPLKFPGLKRTAYQKTKAFINEMHYNYLQKSDAGKAVIAVFRTIKKTIDRIKVNNA